MFGNRKKNNGHPNTSKDLGRYRLEVTCPLLPNSGNTKVVTPKLAAVLHAALMRSDQFTVSLIDVEAEQLNDEAIADHILGADLKNTQVFSATYSKREGLWHGQWHNYKPALQQAMSHAIRFAESNYGDPYELLKLVLVASIILPKFKLEVR